MRDKWTNRLVYRQWCLCRQGVCLSQLQVSLAHRQSWHCRMVVSSLLLRQTIDRVVCVESLRWWENVGESEHDSSGASRKVQQCNCDGRERERRGESDNGQKVRHVIVVLREIADKSWELVNSSNKRLNNGEWTGWNRWIVKLTN